MFWLSTYLRMGTGVVLGVAGAEFKLLLKLNSGLSYNLVFNKVTSALYK